MIPEVAYAGQVLSEMLEQEADAPGRAADLCASPATERLRALGAIEWVAGDALNAAGVSEAARGVSAIVHAANPPGYRNWKGFALPMLESTIAPAQANRARIVLPPKAGQSHTAANSSRPAGEPSDSAVTLSRCT